jgi:ABC-type lipoprotein export system ATPase subunit
MDFLKKLNKEQGKTIVMVTHDDDLANKSGRIEFLRYGKSVKTTIKGGKVK